jgi:hypothetical protein
MSGERVVMYNLVGAGECPVCGYDWWNEPGLYCHCDAPHPDDDEEAAKAYAQSARCREAKLAADALEAARRRPRVIGAVQYPQASANVVPMRRPLTRPHVRGAR